MIRFLAGSLSGKKINVQSGTFYSFAGSDADRIVLFTNNGSVVATVPLDSVVAFPVGSTITVAQSGSGSLTFSPQVGVTLNKNSFDSLTADGQYSYMSLIKTGTDTWDLIGRLTPL